MEEALTEYLLAHTALAALVGTRINWARRPQANALPSVILHRISGLPNYTMAGPSGFVQTRVQADCWAATYKSSKTVAREVLARLSGARMTVGSVVFQGIFNEGHDDSVEAIAGGTDLFRVSMDFLISHNG